MASELFNLSCDLDDPEDEENQEDKDAIDLESDKSDIDENVDEEGNDEDVQVDENSNESESFYTRTPDTETKKDDINKSKVIMWNGQRLHPSQRKVANPSKVWQLAGFFKNNFGVLDQTKAVCSICGQEKDYKGSPSVMLFHLQTKHPDEFINMENN